MADSPYEAGDAAADDPAPRSRFGIVSQFLKDLSFENIDPPAAEGQPAETPHGVVQVDLRVGQVDDQTIDVILHLRVESTVAGNPAYIIEVEYAGRFAYADMSTEVLEMLAMVEAPRLLFPFVRVIIANVSREGGFPALILAPIDFAALYRARRVRQQQAPATSLQGAF
ncbi:MAG: protein-export chaperone SecB [Dongiaceae bacterium]